MFGPLPPLHRLLVIITTLATGIASGIWMAQLATMATATGTALAAFAVGACWGAVAGAALSYLLLHDFHRHPPRVPRH